MRDNKRETKEEKTMDKKEKGYVMSEHGYKVFMSLLKEMNAVPDIRTSKMVYREEVGRTLSSISATIGEME